MAIPSDPQLANQWHLLSARLYTTAPGNPSVWDDYTGDGVKVGVYDSGIQGTHFDLDANFNASREFIYQGVRDNALNNGAHGTSVAGVIAAESNGIDTVGVAYDAEVTGVTNAGIQDIGLTNDTAYVKAYFEHQSVFDVVNHSWGWGTFDSHSQPHDAVYQAVQNAFNVIAQNGRFGLGTVIVAAASNQRQTSQGWDGVSRDANTVGAVVGDRHTITVAGVGRDGSIADYSTPGSNVLVSAPTDGTWGDNVEMGFAGTDMVDDGTAGYQANSDGWNLGTVVTGLLGTSFAAPVVTGVAALMMEANPLLGWRDVREILGLSAYHVGSGIHAGHASPELHDWFENGATNWNGGGRYFSEDYGFGHVDARAAVRLAESWTEIKTSANELTRSVTFFGSGAIPDANAAGSDTLIPVIGNLEVETVNLRLDLTHTFLGDLVITLTSPSGTTTTLLSRVSGTAEVTSLNFASNAFAGESANGNWKVNVSDRAGGDLGNFSMYDLDVYGSAISQDQTYFYTDEYVATLWNELGHGTLDGGAGHDTLNAAAVSGACTINLVSVFDGGSDSTIGGRFLRIYGGIEDVVTGDGDDVVSGNGEGNWLRGMRGVDQLNGYGGDDRLEGGAGGDRLYGGANNDTIIGGAGADTMVGDSGNDVLMVTRFSGNDTVVGGTGNDTLSFELDDSGFLGMTIDLTQSSVTFPFPGLPTTKITYSEIENLTGGASFDTLRGDDGKNVLMGGGGKDTLVGRDGKDVLNGGFANYLDSRGDDGNDTIDGGAGDDRIIVSFGSDKVAGGADTDTLDFAWVTGAVTASLATGVGTFVSSGSWEEPYAGESGFWGGTYKVNFSEIEILAGGSAGDKLTGDSAANGLVGRAGSDRLTGGGGRDFFLFDAALNAATNVDTITDFTVNRDEIRLESTIFAAIGGSLTAGEFLASKSGVATKGSQHILYDTTDGRLFYDPDGDGAQGRVQFATLSSKLSLDHQDFAIV